MSFEYINFEYGVNACIDFLEADCGYEFHEWLGINMPCVEYERHGLCRMYRIGKTSDLSVYGEWRSTKKEAKASYKAALQSKHSKHNRSISPGCLQ